jgi:hypothetical protein
LEHPYGQVVHKSHKVKVHFNLTLSFLLTPFSNEYLFKVANLILEVVRKHGQGIINSTGCMQLQIGQISASVLGPMRAVLTWFSHKHGQFYD